MEIQATKLRDREKEKNRVKKQKRKKEGETWHPAAASTKSCSGLWKCEEWREDYHSMLRYTPEECRSPRSALFETYCD
jgi:hypothetical protein